MNSKAEFFRLAGSTVVIEYKDRSIITSIKIIEFGEKTTTLKYNNISQVCPYKDLGSAKDYVIILLFLMQPSAGDKPDRMQSQKKHNPIYYAQVKTDYESTWQMQLQVPTGAHLLETVTKLEVSRANTGAIPRQA